MKTTHCVLITAALLGMTSYAAGDLLISSGPVYDVFISDPVAVGDGSEGLVGFTLKFTNTTGDVDYNASAFDGVAFGYTGITSGVFNSGTGLHQQYSTVLQPTSPTLDGNYATATDTHFLDLVGDMLVVTPPSELVAAVGPSAEASDALAPFDSPTFGASTDFGSNLTGTFAVTAVPTWELAQIVIKDPGGPLQMVPFGTGDVSLDFFVSGINGGETYHFDLGIGVPEPATLGALALGSLGLLARRRRR